MLWAVSIDGGSDKYRKIVVSCSDKTINLMGSTMVNF